MKLKPSGITTYEELLEMEKNNKIEENLKPIEIIKQQQGEEKYDNTYIPVLNLNHIEEWPSQPLENRRHWTDKVAEEVCLNNCCNKSGFGGACCKLDPSFDLDHVLGPVDEKSIERLINFFNRKGINYKRKDIVIDFEEGKIIGQKFFNGHPVFFKESSYPIMRIKAVNSYFACIFLNPHNNKCTVYSHRPDPMCTQYLCQYVQTNFLVRTPQHPNTFKKLR